MGRKFVLEPCSGRMLFSFVLHPEQVRVWSRERGKIVKLFAGTEELREA